MNFLTTLAHVLFGFISTLSVIVHPVLPVLALIAFVIYELNEEWHLRDEAYDELAEFMAGMFTAMIMLLVDRYIPFLIP
ncbi:MAG: hypothetical protein QXE66_06495 [Desulfurococcaceae archaeon]